MRKLSKLILSFSLVFTFALLVSCGNNEHSHTYFSTWSYDNDSHWHQASCEHASEINDKEAHTFGEWYVAEEATDTKEGIEERTCIICSYKEEKPIPKRDALVFNESKTIVTGLTDYGKTLETIVIPNTVTGIEENAFKGAAVKNITIPDSVTSIKDNSFLGLAIEKATMPALAIPYIVNENISEVEITSGTEIPENAFCNCYYLKSVKLSEGITNIGNYAFYCCVFLHSINMPKALINIGESAFSDCYLINNVTLPEGFKTVGEGAFERCSSLLSINIPSTIESIEDYAFYNCVKLIEVINKTSLIINCGSQLNGYVGYYAKEIINDEKDSKISYKDGFATYLDGDNTILIGYNGEEKEITIPSNVTKIGDYALKDQLLIEKVTISNNVTEIGKNAFENCYSLTSVSMTNSVELIGNFAFKSCENLVNVVLSNSLEAINEGTFIDCISLVSISIPDNVKTIEYQAFAFCYSLHTIDLNNVVSIKGYAFSGDIGLQILNLPDSVSTIGSSAFEDCKNLVQVTLGENISDIAYDAFAFCNTLVEVINKSSLTIEKGSADNGQIAKNAKNVVDNESEFKSKVSIDGDGFAYYTDGEVYLLSYIGKATEVVIPNSVTKISAYAFNGSDITKITLGKNITEIEGNAFHYCYDLREVVLPNSLESIGEFAFYYCKNLLSITIPEKVESILTYAFYGCTKLVEVINNSSLNLVLGDSGNGYVAYYAKAILTNNSESKLSYNDDFATYDDGNDVYLVAYYGEEGEVIIPSNVTVINDYAFYDNYNVENVIIPEGVTTIGEGAFSGCYYLENVKIPNSVKIIADSAFLSTGLNSIVLGNSVESIGQSSFDYTHITSIVVPDSLVNVADYHAFVYNAIENVYYGLNPSVEIGAGVDDYHAVSYYLTENGALETRVGYWWYYDTDGITIIEKIIE